MIKTELEPEDLRFIIPELCVFCKTPTRYWHLRTNQPVCRPCSKIEKVKNIPKK